METHIIVDDNIRSRTASGRWAQAKADLLAGKTIFVINPEDESAKNALHQAFRLDPKNALHRGKRKATTGDAGDAAKGTAFWLTQR